MAYEQTALDIKAMMCFVKNDIEEEIDFGGGLHPPDWNLEIIEA